MSNNIVMAFSPRNIVAFFLKIGLQSGGRGGGGHGHPRTPLATRFLVKGSFLQVFASIERIFPNY